MTTWPSRPLGDVADVIAGQSPEGSAYNAKGEGLPFYQGKKEFGERTIGTPTTWTTKITKVALPGDVLMSVRAPVGPVNVNVERACIGRGLAAIRGGSELDRDFLFYYLLSISTEISGSAGAVFPSINKAEIEAINVPVPAKVEQRRVVNVLDEALAGIATARANAERNLRNARALFESHLAIRVASCFESWPTKTLGEVCDTSAGGTPLTSRRDYYDGGAVPWITSGEVGQGDVHTATRFITDKGLSSSSAKLFPRSTVLVAMYGATAGQVGLLRIEAATNQAVCGVLPSERFVPEFLYYLLIAKREELVAQAAGNAQPNISQAKIRGTLIPLVPLDEQQRVVAVIDALVSRVRELEAIYRRKLAALDELKRSLLHHAFTGQLTERTAAALGA